MFICFNTCAYHQSVYRFLSLLQFICICNFVFWKLCYLLDSIAVSYTHLDVYKRQLSDRFSIQVEYLNEHPDTSVIGTNVYYIDNSSNRYSKTEFPHMKSISLKEAVKQTSLIHPSVMMRKEAILNVNKYTCLLYTSRCV